MKRSLSFFIMCCVLPVSAPAARAETTVNAGDQLAFLLWDYCTYSLPLTFYAQRDCPSLTFAHIVRGCQDLGFRLRDRELIRLTSRIAGICWVQQSPGFAQGAVQFVVDTLDAAVEALEDPNLPAAIRRRIEAIIDSWMRLLRRTSTDVSDIGTGASDGSALPFDQGDANAVNGTAESDDPSHRAAPAGELSGTQ